jgi:hypothetical protein
MIRYLSSDEAGAIPGVTYKTLANWRSFDYGPPYTRAGRIIRYLEQSDLIEWLEGRKVRPMNAGSGEAE